MWPSRYWGPRKPGTHYQSHPGRTTEIGCRIAFNARGKMAGLSHCSGTNLSTGGEWAWPGTNGLEARSRSTLSRILDIHRAHRTAKTPADGLSLSGSRNKIRPSVVDPDDGGNSSACEVQRRKGTTGDWSS